MPSPGCNTAELRNEFIHAVFVLQGKIKHFTRGSHTMDIFGTSIVTFEKEVANFENDIASEKRPSKSLHQH